MPFEVKLKFYYAFIYSKLIYGILFCRKSSLGNKVTLEKIIRRAWKVLSYGNLDTYNSFPNF